MTLFSRIFAGFIVISVKCKYRKNEKLYEFWDWNNQGFSSESPASFSFQYNTISMKTVMYVWRTAPELLRIKQILYFHACQFLIFHHGKMSSTEMANQWRIAVVACLVLFIMIEGAKPVLARRDRLEMRVKALEDRVKALEETCIDKCKR